MELIVTDRASIERGIVIRDRYIVISIYDPEKPKPSIPQRAGMRAVLYIPFHDAEPTSQLDLPAEIQLMTIDDAQQIWEFVQKHRDHVGTIVCHCEQGMSRSPAVAAALSKLLGEDGDRFFLEHQPNEYVYRMMLECQ